MRNKSLHALITMFLLILAVNSGMCQGAKPFDTTAGGDVDTISLTSGSLTLRIPLASFLQRGKLDLSFFIRYNTPSWNKLKTCTPDPDTGAPTCTTSWVPAPGYLGAEPASSTDWRFSWATRSLPVGLSAQSPDGSSHLMNGGTAPLGTGCGSLCAVGPEYPTYSMDATGLLAINGRTLILPNGTVYGFSADVTQAGAFIQASSVTDANGNQITVNSSGWSDTLGRTIPGSQQSCNDDGWNCGPTPSVPVTQPGVPTTDLSHCPAGTSSALVWNVPGVAGTTRTFWFCYSSINLQTSFGDATDEFSGSATMLTAVVLPDLTSWTIAYDSYGGIAGIGLPTGGSLSYAYANQITQGEHTTAHREVTQRIVDANDGAGGRATTYAYSAPTLTTASNGGTQTTFTVTVSSPDGNDTVHTVTNPVVGPGETTVNNLYVVQSQYFQGPSSSGTLLKTTGTQYSGSFDSAVSSAINVLPTQTTTTLPGGQSSKTVLTYNSSGLSQPDGTAIVVDTPVQQDEYDLSGALHRSTLTHYLWQDNSAYKNTNFLALPASITVKDSAGNQAAQTVYAYDETAVNASGVVTALVAPPAGGNIRGNLTTFSRWLNTNSGFVTGHITYLDTGMAASKTDPLGNTTNFTYSPSFAGAYQTQTQFPDTAGVHHIISGNYDFNTGLLSSSTDQNGQVSTYQYDNMLRKAQINGPDGSQTNFFYANPTTIERKRKIDGSRNDDSFMYFDGLGRAIQSQVITPNGPIYTNTTYDPAGRVATVTNPFYSTSDPTYGVTQMQYDALGRETKIIKADGSVVVTQFSSNCVTGTDEAGKTRTGCADAFGKIVEVDETSVSPGTATFAGGTVAINGSLQSTVPSGTPGTGSVTINPSTGGDRSTTITTQSAGSATVSVSIGGSDGTNLFAVQVCTLRCTYKVTQHKDEGTIYLTVNAAGNSYSSSAAYDGTSTTAGLAATLVANFPANPLVSISYASGSSGFTLNAAAGSAGNSYSVATSAQSSCVTTSTPDDPSGWTCGSQGWTTTPTSANFSGGTDAVTQTIYDTGTVTITVNGHNDGVSFASPDTALTIAGNLVTAINGDANAPVTASISGNTVNLKSKANGSPGNLSLASSYTWDTSHFSSAYFTTTNSAAALTGGGGGVPVYDSGFISLSVGGYTATQVPYGQSTNANAVQVASALAASLNNANSPVNATTSGDAITLVYKTPGPGGNVTVTSTSTTSLPQYFSSPSFSIPGTTLFGGANPQAPSGPYVTLYSYDVLGNLISVNQKGDGSQAARVRSFAYDSLSRLLLSANPETGTITYSYDNADNLLTKTAPAPNQFGSVTVTTTYQYDALNRMTSRAYSDGTPGGNFIYDVASGWGNPTVNQSNLIGRLSTATSGTAGTVFSYDAVGRVNANNQCSPMNCGTGNFALSYTYDLLGHTTSYTTGPGVIFSQSFDGAGRLAQLTSNLADGQHPGTLVTVDPANGYYPAGDLHKATVGNGLTETTAFNVRLQPCRTNLNSSGTLLSQCTDPIPSGNVQDFTYGFNAGSSDNGALVSFSASGIQNFNRGYTYDALNRLQSMSAPGDSCSGLTWAYDAWGNRVAQTVTGGTCFSFEVLADSNNKLQAMPFQYDAAGNLINDSNHTYTYNAANRIVQVDGGQTATYIYDAFGRRVEKVAGGTRTDYLYGVGGNVVTEYNNGCASICWATSYIYLGGTVVAEYKDGTTYFIHPDHLGSTRLMTKMDETIKDSMDFLPYGEQIGGASGTTHKFTGQERDAESNLDFFGARNYSSSLGRFMSADWSTVPTPVPYANLADPQTLNLYSYGRNAPITNTDPDGHTPWMYQVAPVGSWNLDTAIFSNGPIIGGPDDPSSFDSTTFFLGSLQVTLFYTNDGGFVTGYLMATNSNGNLVGSGTFEIQFPVAFNATEQHRYVESTTLSTGYVFVNLITDISDDDGKHWRFERVHLEYDGNGKIRQAVKTLGVYPFGRGAGPLGRLAIHVEDLTDKDAEAAFDGDLKKQLDLIKDLAQRTRMDNEWMNKAFENLAKWVYKHATGGEK